MWMHRIMKGRLTVADSIDWRRVKSVRTLCMVADIYEVNGELEKEYADAAAGA